MISLLEKHHIFTTLLLVLLLLSTTRAIRMFPTFDHSTAFSESPKYVNNHECESNPIIHIAMTLDSKYSRGSIASVHSILMHSSCPENIHFHFIASASTSSDLTKTIKSTFPNLPFKIYPFDKTVRDLISHSIRPALDNPLNYARIYLAEILDPSVSRVVYLDSDTIVVDDIKNLWSVTLSAGSRVIGAPEYCHTNFTNYFNSVFWSDPNLSKVFRGKKSCYFNTGVMVMDLKRWRDGDYTKKIEQWMEIQKHRRIYELGSLPPFMLVFSGEIQGIDHRWNQHGLGGDNVVNSCRSLHPGPVSLLHWSGKGKPWVRIDEGRACPVDYIWAPYDLLRLQRFTEQM